MHRKHVPLCLKFVIVHANTGVQDLSISKGVQVCYLLNTLKLQGLDLCIEAMCFHISKWCSSFQKYNIVNSVVLVTQLRESLCSRHQCNVVLLHFAALNPATELQNCR